MSLPPIRHPPAGPSWADGGSWSPCCISSGDSVQETAMQPAARILLIVGGGIAAYKACELIRLIRKAGMTVRCVLTEGGAQFVTPMTLAALSENPVHSSLWD